MCGFWKTNCRSDILNFIKLDFVKSLFDSILYLFFPLKCLKCQKKISLTNGNLNGNLKNQTIPANDFCSDLFNRYYCDDCLCLDFEYFEPPFCEKCGKKFNYDKDEHILNCFCKDCLKPSDISIGKVRAGARYLGIIKKSIHFFKYQKKLMLKKPLGQILFKGFNQYFTVSELDLIISVPLHISKLRQRGFNQSFLVAQILMGMLRKANTDCNLRTAHNALERVKKTDPQIQFSAEQRKENVKDAFKVVNKAQIQNKRILLIDDVYTTGATSMEAGRALLKAGALSVDVLVIARV